MTRNEDRKARGWDWTDGPDGTAAHDQHKPAAMLRSTASVVGAAFGIAGVVLLYVIAAWLLRLI